MRTLWSFVLLLSFAASADGISTSGLTGSASQNNGSTVNRVVGMMLIPSGISLTRSNDPGQVSIGISFIAMGIVALAQKASDSSASGQSAGVASVTSTTPTGTTGTASTASATRDSSNTTAAFQSALSTPAGQQARAAIAAAGGTLTASGVKMPDGRYIPISSFASPATVQAAGINSVPVAQKLAEIQKQLAQPGETIAESKSATSGVPLNTASAGIPGGHGNSQSADMPPASPFQLTTEQREQLIAGKTVLHGGEPVGVRSDNLFTIVHRAYARQQADGNFLPP